MKKNYRKIPGTISAKIDNFNADSFQVCILRKVSEEELKTLPFNNFNFDLMIETDNFNDSFIPNSNRGTFSKKNIDGYKIVYRDQEKVYKTWYAGERPYYGDWSKGSFSLYITKLVFPSLTVAPKELSLNVEVLDVSTEGDKRIYTLKIYVDLIINKNSISYNDDLFFALNLMQENFGDADVFETNLTIEDYLSTLIVNWEIFPPGTREADIQRLTSNRRNITPNYLRELENRYDNLIALNPQNIISGVSGMRNYFGMKFSNRLVVFENLQYGNAIYLLFENWEELSRLSRTELLKRPEDQFYRIEHKFGWQTKLVRTIEGRR